jgi:hypothetical protein
MGVPDMLTALKDIADPHKDQADIRIPELGRPWQEIHQDTNDKRISEVGFHLPVLLRSASGGGDLATDVQKTINHSFFRPFLTF